MTASDATANRNRLGRFAVPALPILGLALMLLTFYPGWLSFDSGYQLWQVQHQQFNNLSPVLMTAILSLLNAANAYVTPAPLFILNQCMFWLGIYLISRSLTHTWRGALAMMLVLGFICPVWIVIGHLWTDALMISSAALGLGLTLYGQKERLPALFWLAAFPLILAGAVRLNALPIMLPLYFFWAINNPAFLLRKHFLKITLALTVMSFALATLVDRAVTTTHLRTWPISVLHDLAALSIASNNLELPAFTHEPALTVEDLKQRYLAYSAMSVMMARPIVRSGLQNDDYSNSECLDLIKIWLSGIAHQPLAYLAHRGNLLYGMFFLPRMPNNSSFATSDLPYGDMPQPKERGAMGQWLTQALSSSAARVYFSFMPWLLLLGLVYAYRALRAQARPSPYQSASDQSTDATRALPKALIASAVLQILSLFVFAPSTEFRYLAWSFFCTALLICIGTDPELNRVQDNGSKNF